MKSWCIKKVYEGQLPLYKIAHKPWFIFIWLVGWLLGVLIMEFPSLYCQVVRYLFNRLSFQQK